MEKRHVLIENNAVYSEWIEYRTISVFISLNLTRKLFGSRDIDILSSFLKNWCSLEINSSIRYV